MKKIYFILILTFAAKVLAQDPFYYRIDRSKGLPSNTVYDMYQDANGFMWFSGSFGLCRYDGNDFLTYEANHNSSKSGSGIKQDSTGRIWYCNFDGKLLYVENGKISQLKQNSAFGFFHFAIIKNYLYAIENNEIAIYDLRTLKKEYHIPFDSKNITCSHGSENHFYIITDKLHIISSATDVQTVELPAEMESKMEGIMIQNSGNDLLLVRKYNTVAYRYSKGEFKAEKVSSQDFIQNVSTGKNRFWLSTTNGIKSYENNGKAGFSATFLKNNNVSDVLEDRSGHLWFSTLDKGVRFIPDLKTQFFYSNYSPNVMHAFKNNVALIGTDNETLYTTNFDPLHLQTLYTGNSNHAFNNLFVDEASSNIFATSNTFKMFDKNGKLKSEISLAVKDIVKIQENVYAYAATWQCGLLTINKVKTKWDSIFSSLKTRVKDQLHFKPIVNNVRGKSVAFFEKTNAIYFSSNKGLLKVTTSKVKELTLNGESVNVTKLVVSKNKLFALTVSAQLFRIDEQDAMTEIETTNFLSGQKPTFIKSLNNEMYIFSKNSVFHYDFDQNVARKIISINDDFEWHDIALLNDKLLISTSKGYILTSPTNKIQYAKPVFVIDSIRNGSITEFAGSFNVVRAENSNVSVYFSHVSFNPDNQSFVHFKVNNGEWNKISDNRNVIDFEKLKPGKYSIAFMYGNGFENSEMSVLNFKVNKPFWLTWWFIVIAMGLFGLFLFNFDKWRTERINRRSLEIIARINLEKTANQSKLKALKSQMNPHFFFNALNTIQSFILENDKKMAISVLSKFSNLTRSILEMSDRDEVTIAEEIKVLQLYLDIEKVRFNNDFEYKITTNNFDKESYKIPSLLLQPYVENAIKHGLLHKNGSKLLLISFDNEPKYMRIEISDNGIGRKKSMELNAIKNKKHDSFATQAIEKRVKLLNEFAGKEITVEYIDLTIEINQKTGTTVIVKIIHDNI